MGADTGRLARIEPAAGLIATCAGTAGAAHLLHGPVQTRFDRGGGGVAHFHATDEFPRQRAAGGEAGVQRVQVQEQLGISKASFYRCLSG